MDEFVSKKLLVAKFNELASKYIDGDKRQRGLAYATAADMIAFTDAADVQPIVYAHKTINVGRRSYCSNCGKLAIMEDYCSKCGAKVEEV